MSGVSERVLIAGDAGNIETVLEHPRRPLRGAALVAHPHPLYGGTLDNKVVQTLARAFRDLGYVALRANFRGAGASQGEHDAGEGETQDLVRVAAWAVTRFGCEHTVLAGYSFGAYVQTRVAKRVALERMVLVGLAAGPASGERNYAPDPYGHR